MCLHQTEFGKDPRIARELEQQIRVEQQIQREFAARELARRRLMHYVIRFEKKYQPGWVHHDICARLERFVKDVEAGLSPRLMLMMPPRSGKSTLASINFPSWVLGKHPDWELINASYALSLPADFSKLIRERMRSKEYTSLFRVNLDPEDQKIEGWKTTEGGGYRPVGVGGPLTGKGAHILIIDDPIKDAEEADSETIRKKLHDWYGSTAYTRIAPGGGVLVIQCMTGDTPVLMPDGTERRLDTLRSGDEVATYEDGRLTSAPVAKWKSNGRDSIYRITMSSGRVVRANGRHPFLTSDGGELKWVRTRALTTASTIVAVPVNGGNGKACSAPSKAASFPSGAAGIAVRTTRKKSGLTGIVHRLSTQLLTALRTSSTATVSQWKSTTAFFLSRVVSALFVGALDRPLLIGAERFASTTVTTPARFEDFSATIATSQLDVFGLSRLHSPWLNTSEFILDRVVSVELDGEEEVFDVQIERTENFIANGLVSHNTCWHDDDLVGHELQKERDNIRDGVPVEERENWEEVRYPALAERDEYISKATGKLAYDEPVDDTYELVRKKGEALHPARFPVPSLLKIKRTLQPRHWSALYQQNPVPDDGAYFEKGWFREYTEPYSFDGMTPMIAGDLAIGEKQTNDYTVLPVGYLNWQGDIFVPDLIRGRMSSHVIVDTLMMLGRKYNAQLLGLEYGQLFLSIKPTLLEAQSAPDNKHIFSIDETLKPFTDKMARARTLQGLLQQGRIYFPRGQPWVEIVKHELLRFPGGVHDDCVDALAWLAILAMKTPRPRKPTRSVTLKSWKDQLGQFVAGGDRKEYLTA